MAGTSASRTDDLCWAEASTLVELVRTGRTTATEITCAVLDRIAKVDGKVNAFVTVCEAEARAAAAAADARRPKGDVLGQLDGVPVSLKDIIMTGGIRTTAGSLLETTFVPESDALVVSRLKAAGAIIIGKTTTPEYCHKTVTDSPLTGTTRNPWDLERTPGGSSGGSAAAVAAGMGPLSIGTDGGGSIRLPAALCGVVGFKPTYGAVPQWPVFPGWDLLGHTGPLARTVGDVELAIRVIGGPDPHDPSSLISTRKASRGRPRVAWTSTLDHLAPEPPVARALMTVVTAARKLSSSIEEVEINWSDPDQQFRVIVLSEIAAAYGHRLACDADRNRMDPTLIQMLEFGQSLKASDLARALTWKRSFAARLLTWFEGYDLLIVPTAPVTAFPLGSIGPRVISGRKTSPYAWFNWTWPFNVSGQPALSLPVFSEAGLPAGIQIVGRPGEDALVLRFARQVERSIGSSGALRPCL
jgi:aspartyl-tRNA(Asn)/glutamyl-tRNA(Gln) amidotransferase subunit A